MFDDIVQEQHLAPFATRASASRGRPQPDHDTAYRGLFQRDRDRIVHSSAFRRLQFKTQVFVSIEEGDYFRSRLTHTLEVTQIARTIARALGLNEDLTEALALAHDLGHGPFGHSGENALDEMMKTHGGFDHNAQGLRVVDFLEVRYPRFRGLNLTYETREGFVKNYVPDGRPGRPRAALGFAANEMPSLEVQLVGHADEIAYDTHDLDDGLVSGALEEEKVRTVPLWREIDEQIRTEHSDFKTNQRLRWSAIVRRMIATLVTDLLNETRRRLKQYGIGDVKDVRACREELVGFSAEVAPRKLALETFLMEQFYYSPRVRTPTALWQNRVTQLYKAISADPNQVPEEQRQRAEARGEHIQRTICDYIAGMTDRFARKQWETLVGKD